MIGRLSALLLLSICIVTPATAAAQDDYLSAELRARVDALKHAVRTGSPPADEAALMDRVQVTWEWLNAWAMAGRYVPPESPQAIARMHMAVARALPGTQRASLADIAATFAPVVLELAFLDDHPDGLGRPHADALGPFEADSWVTITQTYVVGTQPMPPGSRLVAAQHRLTPGSLQATEPGGDNFVSVRASRPDVVLKPDVEYRGGMHGGFGAQAPTAAFEVVAGTLRAGDEVGLVYGDRSGGSRGIRVPHFSNDAFPLPLYVTFAGDPVTYAVPQLFYRVRGGALARAHGFAPSILDVGEAFDLTIRGEDRFLNRAHGTMPGWRLTLNGEPWRELAPGGEALTRLAIDGFRAPGVYRIGIESLDGTAAGDVNPIKVEQDPRRRVYWGDTHGHGGMAEGQGTSDEFFRFGRDDARLDFLVHSEHDIWMDDYEWEEIRRNTIAYHDPGQFVTFLGYEWTVPAAWGGHHNVLFRSPAQRERVPRQTHPRQADLYRGLRERYRPEDVLIIPHAHQPGNWQLTDPGMERLVEIASLHGVFQWYGEMFLHEHHRVGFVGATDDHTSHPGHMINRGRRGGLAAVRAPEATRDALFDAMRRLDTFATTGARAIVDFAVNGSGMGTTIAAEPGGQHVTANIVGTEQLDRIELIRNGAVIERRELMSRPNAADGRITVEVRFASESTPPGMVHAVPRGERAWGGRVRVHGAEVVAYEAPGFIDPRTQQITATLGVDGEITFRTGTRGHGNRFLMQVACNDRCNEATIVAAVRGVETVTIPMRRALEGVTIATPDGEWSDAITIRSVAVAPLEYTFEFHDPMAIEGTSWYYLRVVQRDDQEIWSSPVWVIGQSHAATDGNDAGWWLRLRKAIGLTR